MQSFNAEWARLSAGVAAEADAQRREVAALSRKIDHLVEAISDGDRSPGLRSKLAELEARRDRVAAAAAIPAARPPALHPGVAEVYRTKLATLQQALADKDDPAALEAARAPIEEVIISPPEGDDDPPSIELIGDLAELLRAAGLSATTQGGATPANDVLNVFASSVNEGPGQSPGIASFTRSPWRRSFLE